MALGFTRYGDEGGLAGLMAIMQAMISICRSQDDSAKALTWGQSRVVFCCRGNMALVAMSRANESTAWVYRQLEYLYNQVSCVAHPHIINVIQVQSRQLKE